MRTFSDRAIPEQLVDLLCAVALSAPTKSDLQQRDIVILRDVEPRAALDTLLAGHGWRSNAPVFLVFCGNHRRQRHLHALSGHPFVNDHLDAFFNASVDAGIALATFVTAAEAVGLGCCPVSAIRNESAAVSDLLGLPDFVFPVAGLAIGWPEARAPISPRLDLSQTVHLDRMPADLEIERAAITGYDARRLREEERQRAAASPKADAPASMAWSEKRARQYAKPERVNFGDFIRTKGFKLM